MKQFFYAVLLAFTMVGFASVRADDAAASLGKVNMFAFGGIGIVGSISEGERLFNNVMSGPDAQAKFRTILGSGTTAARLYALCGIRVLDKASFAEAAKVLKNSKSEVETAAGCMISLQPASSIVRYIEDGRYDYNLSKKRGE